MTLLKRFLIILLSLTLAIGCSSALEPEASQGGNDADLVNNGDGSVEGFINKYAGVYYREEEGRVKYKLRNGKVYTINGLNSHTEIPVEKVSAAESKLQIRYADEGTVEVLKFIGKGYTGYTSYILEKVSENVEIATNVGGYVKEFARYKGTYKSIEQNIEHFIAIDENGYIYFHDSAVTVEGGRVGMTDGELTIIESTKDGVGRKIIFKFDQGVYREYNIDGNHIDRTGVFYGVTKDFIETLGDSTYATEDGKSSIMFNGATTRKEQGSVFALGSYFTMPGLGMENNDNIGNVTVLKGKTLNIMKYRANLTFSDDYSTLTYVNNGQTIEFKKQQ